MKGAARRVRSEDGSRLGAAGAIEGDDVTESFAQIDKFQHQKSPRPAHCGPIGRAHQIAREAGKTLNVRAFVLIMIVNRWDEPRVSSPATRPSPEPT